MHRQGQQRVLELSSRGRGRGGAGFWMVVSKGELADSSSRSSAGGSTHLGSEVGGRQAWRRLGSEGGQGRTRGGEKRPVHAWGRGNSHLVRCCQCDVLAVAVGVVVSRCL